MAEIDMQAYGRMEQQVEQLTQDMLELKATVKAMNDLLQQSKGGYKTLVWLGGVAGAAGAAITWILTHMKVTP